MSPTAEQIKQWETPDPRTLFNYFWEGTPITVVYDAFFKDPRNQAITDIFVGTYHDVRKRIAGLAAAAPPAGVDTSDIHIDDLEISQHKIKAILYRPKNVAQALPVVLACHGGGFVAGGLSDEHAFCALLARRGYAALNIEYRLAPEHACPAAADDCFSALQWVIENASKYSFDTTKIISYGTSAGGNLAAVLAQRARDEGIKLKGVLLRIPTVCNPQVYPKNLPNDSMRNNTDTAILRAGQIPYLFELYGGSLPHTDYRLSPLLGNLKDLPPHYIQLAGMDPLRDEGLAYAKYLKDAGVSVEHRLWPGVVHGFHILPFPQAQEMSDDLAAGIARLLQ